MTLRRFRDALQFAEVTGKGVVDAGAMAEETSCSGLPDPAWTMPIVRGFEAKLDANAVVDLEDAWVINLLSRRIETYMGIVHDYMFSKHILIKCCPS